MQRLAIQESGSPYHHVVASFRRRQVSKVETLILALPRWILSPRLEGFLVMINSFVGRSDTHRVLTDSSSAMMAF